MRARRTPGPGLRRPGEIIRDGRNGREHAVEPGRGAPAAAALLALLAFAAPRPASGQAAPGEAAPPDTAPEPRYAGEPITVTVTRAERELERLPYAVSVVGREQIQDGERLLSLEESLESVPGVSVQNRRNHSLGDRVTIRGSGARAQFGVRGLRVLADGIPLTMPDGQSALTNLDLASAGRVEVIRGPASALYGNAAGGVIRYRTQEFSPSFCGAPRVTAGSHGYLATRVKASGRAGGTDGAGYVLSAGRVETDGFRRHARAEMYRGNLVVRTRLGPDTRLRAVLNGYDRPFAENPSSLSREDARENPRKARSFVVQQGAGEEATQVQGGATLSHRLGPEAEVEATAWAARRDVWNPIPTRIIDLGRLAGGLRTEARWRGRLAGMTARWTAGFDAAVQRDQRREAANRGIGGDRGRAREGDELLDQRERVSSLGPFAQLAVDPAQDWRLTAALRYDAYRFEAEDRHLSDGDASGDRVLTNWSPAVGVSFAPVPGLAVYANASTAFETPTTSELSNRPSGEGGFNPELGPEQLRTVEAGAKGRAGGGRLRWQLTGYLSEVEDALIPFEGPSEEVFFRNAGRVERKGLEASLSWRPVPPLRARVAYTLQENTFVRFETDEGDFSGNDEPGVPGHRVYAGLVYTAPVGLRTEVDVRWVPEDYPVNDENTAHDWSYEVTDVRLLWERGVGAVEARPFLGIDNLFDVRYNGSVVPNAFGDRFYEPAPGREVFGGLRLRVGG